MCAVSAGGPARILHLASCSRYHSLRAGAGETRGLKQTSHSQPAQALPQNTRWKVMRKTANNHPLASTCACSCTHTHGFTGVGIALEEVCHCVDGLCGFLCSVSQLLLQDLVCLHTVLLPTMMTLDCKQATPTECLPL